MRRWMPGVLLFFAVYSAVLCGCSITDVSEGERTEADYTVLGAGEVPAEVERVLAEQKEEPFQISYESDGYLYVLKGYGPQKSGGYSIQVEEVYIRGDALHVKTSLVGPATKEEQRGSISCPCIVLKLEARKGLSVVFEE